MRVTIGAILHLGFLTVSMCGKSGVKKRLPSYCTTDKSDDPSKPSCFSLADFPSGGSIPANSPREGHLFPPWMNEQLARKGQQFAQQNLFGMQVSHVFGLFSSVYPDAAGILCFTGGVETAALAEKRYLALITHFVLWYDDLLGGNSTNSGSDILASMRRTRALHISIAENAHQQMSKKLYLNDPEIFSEYNMTTALSGPFFRDLHESNIPSQQRKPSNVNPAPKLKSTDDVKYPFNQQVAALMVFSLVGYPVAFPERVGIDVEDEEALWGFNHLWAVLSYAVGIDDKYNLALQPNLTAAKEAYRQIFEDYNVRTTFNLNKDWISLVMAEKSLYGLVQILPILSPNMILYRMLVDLFQVPGKHTYKILTPADKITNALFEADRESTLGGKKEKMAALSHGFRAVLMRDGVAYFGSDYVTQRDRARHAFFTMRPH